MKKMLLIALLAMGALFAQAQTKGTNTLGLGVNVSTSKMDGSGQTNNEQKNRAFSLGYGHFIKDNERIGINFSYGKYEQNGSATSINTVKSYGGSLTYQKYYPLFKKLYAFAGGRGGYSNSSNDYNNSTYGQGNKDNLYTLGAYGGVTWFVSKRFAFEADLLAADIFYRKTKYNSSEANETSNSRTTTDFNLSTSGAINNLGFKIYFLF